MSDTYEIPSAAETVALSLTYYADTHWRVEHHRVGTVNLQAEYISAILTEDQLADFDRWLRRYGDDLRSASREHRLVLAESEMPDELKESGRRLSRIAQELTLVTTTLRKIDPYLAPDVGIDP